MSEPLLLKVEEFDQGIKNWVAKQGKDQIFKQDFSFPFVPPSEKLLWSGLLKAILGSHFTIDVEPVATKLASLGGYATPTEIDVIIDDSLLGLLPPELKGGLSQTISEAYGQAAAWSSGEWHRDLKQDPKKALKEAEDLFLLPSPWEAAHFLANLGYPFVYSQGAYQAFLRFAGIKTRLPYGDWYSALVEYFGSAEKARAVDFAWEWIFSNQSTGVMPPLCEEKPDCYPCPLKENCDLYQNRISQKADKKVTEKLAIGREQELEPSDLLRFLLKDAYGETELQQELLASFPHNSNLAYHDLNRSHLDQKFYSRYLAVLALCRKFNTNEALQPGTSFTSSSQVFEHFRYSLARQKQESFYIVLLDRAFTIIRLDEISRGIIDESLVHPREVFAQAIQLRASSVILIHNHPAGTLAASDADKQVTQRLVKAAKIIGIKILDHIILCEKGYFSFDENGLMKEFKN